MKKKLLFLALATSVAGYAQKPFKMEGVIKNVPNIKEVKIEVSKPNLTDMEPEVTVEVKKGKFQFTTKIDCIVEANISYGEGNMASVFLVPNENLQLTLDGNEYFYGGSKFYKQCDAADRAITSRYLDFMNYATTANVKLRQLSEEEQKKVVVSMRDTLIQKQKAYNTAIETYRTEHGTEEGSMLYLSKYLKVKDEYEKMSDAMKSGYVGTYYKRLIEIDDEILAKRMKEAEEEEAKRASMNGKPAKDFTLNDINGKPLSLSSLKGKYVVLDFWGSWCSWCIKGIPEMKKYYEKYAGKFEILGVDCSDTEKAWKDAVAKYELPWLHVYNPRESTLLSDYAVSGFPTKMVIDPEGKLIKTIVGEAPAFYEYLDEILGK